MVDQVYLVGSSGDCEVDVLSASRLYVTIMENYRGAINDVVIAILTKCFQRLFQTEIKLSS